VSGSTRRPQGEFDTSKPNVARMNDYLLGGKDNFAADRQAGERLLAVAPDMKTMMVENRRFLGRAVRHLAEQGIRQFFDMGAGLPTRQNTHEVARTVDPAARVIYVDNDPVVICHGRAILERDDRTAVVEGDILHPEDLVCDRIVRRVIDFDEPVAILICGALHFIPNSDDPYKRIAWLRDAIAPGSHLVLSHAVFEGARPDTSPVGDVYQKVLGCAEMVGPRPREEVLRFFDGFELVEPGLVYVRQWRPDNPLAARAAERIRKVGGVGRKP
jgi:O-methyltransferase involved in polyketide biosynthesis